MWKALAITPLASVTDGDEELTRKAGSSQTIFLSARRPSLAPINVAGNIAEKG